MRVSMLVLSAVLGVAPIAGAGLILASGWMATVDGLFMALILLSIGGVFLANAAWEAKALIPKRAEESKAKAHGA